MQSTLSDIYSTNIQKKFRLNREKVEVAKNERGGVGLNALIAVNWEGYV